ncbi:Wall-associated kinase family protein [Rhynchospora pubera]|uniref:Wall-associated kinase family protein n=1 Tax=Rhynchospora pubera TaxID=906938 RepID=A0AAV8E7V6_9POAL|nr:Wall-associated kinase family protein [Rhynchospora pubera]
MEPRAISRTIPSLVSLLLILTIMALFMPVQIVASAIALPGCRETCGDVQIPYPFGIGPNCSLPGFEISCNISNGSPAPFLFNNIPVLAIYLPWREAPMVLVNNNITSICMSNTTSSLNLSGTPYRINNGKEFIVVGCDITANITFGNETNKHQGVCSTVGCYNPDTISNSYYSFCSGAGCCQISISEEVNYYQITLQAQNYNSSKQYNSSQCGHAVVANFYEYSDYNIDELYEQQQMPLYLDWSIGNEGCKTARANKSSYACIDSHSECVESDNGPGYVCMCSDGYGGNPYLEGGCQVHESYYCPAFMRLKNNTDGDCQLYVPYVIGYIVGVRFIIGFSVLLLYFGIWIWKRIKLVEKIKQQKLKEKFFNQNKGFLLQQRIASDEDATQRMRIFSLDELKKATNKFDKALILGQGGHGEVYKGILSDQRTVAIKKSKIVDQVEIEQFINEVVILSQINHRNVVKLYGCCLETEVPLLVYEFISNGTLSNHLHAESYAESCNLTWNHRLRIALETARAIAYLHSSASISVLHRDIKSANILLDNYFTAKVSDFGASRSVQIDQTGITTVVQGTFGYLDPEYFYNHRLTPKSDVYSFGVILAELLTREKPSSSTMLQVGGLVTYFTSAMREKRLFEIVDPQVVDQVASNEVQKTEIEAVANLAEMCIRRNGDERPMMKEVEVQLEVLWRSNQRHDHPCTSQTLEESQLPLPDSTSENTTTRQYSFELELHSSFTFPR